MTKSLSLDTNAQLNIRTFPFNWKEEKEEIWLSLMTKAPTPREKSTKQRDNTKTPQNID